MSDPSAPSNPDTPPRRPDQPAGGDRAPITIDQEGRPAGGPSNAAPQTEAAAEAAPQAPPAPAQPPPRHNPVGLALGILGFLILAGALGYVWQQQQQLQQMQAATAAQAQTLGQQVRMLNRQLTQLKAQPAVQVPAALNALAGKLAALEQQKTPDLSPIEARLTALEQRQPAELAPLQSEVRTLRQRVAELSQQSQKISDLTQQAKTLSEQVTTLTQQVQASATRGQQADSALTQRLDTDESRLVALEHNASQIGKLSERATRLARLQAAQMALAQGHKLGDIPGAPAALARYATEPPPTEASLRLTFPAAEQAAISASTPDVANKPFLARVLANAEGLVTVRQGNRVLVGNATAGVLARARAALDAGDLAGAVADLGTLTGGPAKAMQTWLHQATALLAARSALAEMMAQA